MGRGMTASPQSLSPAGAPPALQPPPVFAAVQDDLASLEVRLRDTSGLDFPVLSDLLDWIFGSGGKRIRPALVFTVARTGPANTDAVQCLAAAVETLHAATLVHDDLVDGSALRRGRPTLNTRWTAGATVLAGDWLFARAARFAAAAQNVRVMDVFARTLGTLTDGELRQLFGRRGIPTLAEYEYRIYAKTAALFEAATEAGAVLAGQPEAAVAALAEYGRQLGVAFQIVDDVLDFSGDAVRLGKPVGSDLRGGTVTLPALLYFADHPEAAADLTRADGASDGAVDDLVAAIQAGPAMDAARAEADARVARAVMALDGLADPEARDTLARIAHYAVERDV
jgi:geranylgeranyl pyrophosphate synthase